MSIKFAAGEQITYVPLHAEGDPNHKDAQHGFVTSVRNPGTRREIVFCRFWFDNSHTELRTKANSEGCRPDDLIHEHHVAQRRVVRLLQYIRQDTLAINQMSKDIETNGLE